MTAKIKMDFETNAKQTAQDVGALGDKIDKTGKKAQEVGKGFSGLKGKIMGAFGPLAVGGAIAKGIKMMVDDLGEVAERTKEIAKATRELRGLAGQAGVERMNKIAKEMEFDKTELLPLLSSAISGGALMSNAEQDQLVKDAIMMERGKGMPAVEAVKFGASVFNADPTYWRERGGITGAMNQVAVTAKQAKMTQLEGRAMIPAISEASSAGIPTSQGAGLFSAITQVSEPFPAGTQAKAIIKGFQNNKKDNESLMEFVKRASTLPASEQTKAVGEGKSALKTAMDNMKIWETVVRRSAEASTGELIAREDYKEALKDDKRAMADIAERAQARDKNIEMTAEDLGNKERGTYEAEYMGNKVGEVVATYLDNYIGLYRNVYTLGQVDETSAERFIQSYGSNQRQFAESDAQSKNEIIAVQLRKTAEKNRTLSEGN